MHADMGMLSPFYQTSSCEAFHSLKCTVVGFLVQVGGGGGGDNSKGVGNNSV